MAAAEAQMQSGDSQSPDIFQKANRPVSLKVTYQTLSTLKIPVLGSDIPSSSSKMMRISPAKRRKLMFFKTLLYYDYDS